MHRQLLGVLSLGQMGLPARSDVVGTSIPATDMPGQRGGTAMSGAKWVLQKDIARPGRPGEIVVLEAASDNVMYA
jgi:hypothetical protein